ncbi:MAG: hypothetical protein GY749_09765 [Desulfobacteraceae bacterium]|nr:hypothetical protein [Desulfobacteraceae bacterium]
MNPEEEFSGADKENHNIDEADLNGDGEEQKAKFNSETMNFQSEYLAGRDINIYKQSKPDFFEPDLSPFKPPKYHSPPITPTLIDIILSQRLLVLGGDDRLDKSALARHIAYKLQNKLNTQHNKIAVLEWNYSIEPQKLITTIQAKEQNKIFILPKVFPKHVNHDLFSLKKASEQNYIIMNTDIPKDRWGTDMKTEIPFWLDLSIQDVYDSSYLAETLIRELYNATNLPTELENFELTPEQVVVGKLTIQGVAESLKLPYNVSVFVHRLCTETKKRPLKERRVQKLIEECQDDKNAILKWYRYELNLREQSLILGLSFFDGLLDEQFFAAFQMLVEQIWHKRDKSLETIDYWDMENLYNYFNFIEADNYEKIEIQSSERRRKLFKVAWESHRRQIMSALPVLVKFVKDSVHAPNTNRELYETMQRSERLRSVISRTFSEIGFISSDSNTTGKTLLHRSVENSLLQLAADDHIEVQAVAAHAIAQWRSEGYDKILFDTLNQWQRYKRITDGPEIYIRATVALAVGYASIYDPPNKLDTKLCTLLKKLSNDPNTLVLDRFCRYTLPILISFHMSQQLSGLLLDMIRPHVWLNVSIAEGLAQAYNDVPKQVLQTLSLFHKKYDEYKLNKNGNSKTIIKKEADDCDAALATAAITYGEIQYNDSGLLTIDEAFNKLHDILSSPTHPYVRNAVVYAIARQAVRHFEKIEPHLLSIVGEVEESERDEVIAILTQVLTQIYLMQRENLEEGDDIIEINGRKFPIWIDTDRPTLTDIEKTLFRWLKSTNKVAQEVAIQASVNFAKKIDIEEKERIEVLKENRSEVEYVRTDSFVKKIAKRRPDYSFYIKTFSPWLSTIVSKKYYLLVRGAISEVFWQDKSDQTSIQFVLEKWHNSSEHQISTIAKLVGRALSIAKNPGILLLIIFVIIVVVWILS